MENTWTNEVFETACMEVYKKMMEDELSQKKAEHEARLVQLAKIWEERGHTVQTNFMSEFIPALLKKLGALVTKHLPTMNRRFGDYVKGEKTQDKGINGCFESIVEDATRQTLDEVGIVHSAGMQEVRSDTARETATFILHNDAKGCNVSEKAEFTVVQNDGFHMHNGIRQTSLTSDKEFIDRKTKERTVQVGQQVSELEEKRVYTLVSWMRWGFNAETRYFVESIGVVELPHTRENVKFNVGKSKDEMRLVLMDPEAYQHIHRFAV